MCFVVRLLHHKRKCFVLNEWSLFSIGCFKMRSHPYFCLFLLVREARNEGTGRGGGRGGRGFGRGGRGSSFNRESANENSLNVTSGVGSGEENVSKPSGGRGSYGDRPRGPYRGGRRGGFSDGVVGDDERSPRRQFERRSGTGRGYVYLSMNTVAFTLHLSIEH